MGSKISGICGTEGRGNGEISLQVTSANPEEVSKAKSASKTENNTKDPDEINKEKFAQLQEIKAKLDQKSQQDNEFVSIENMKSKISLNVFETEKKLSPFNKEPEINEFLFSFEREPIQLKDGAVYFGQWNEKGQRHGYGVLVRVDGSKYEGFFYEDLLQGRGRYIESEGKFYYEGIFNF